MLMSKNDLPNKNKIELILNNRHLHDLNPLFLGYEQCEPNQSFGPAVRNYTLLHYVVSGKGTFFSGGNLYQLQAGDVFRILPGEVTVYKADKDDPWVYRWLGFNGELSQKIAQLPPTFKVSATAARCFMMEESEVDTEYRIASKLFRLYAELFSSTRHTENYVGRVQNYIEFYYMQKIRVEDIAKLLNLDRRYLSRLFRQKTGMTVQEYLISVRMEEATQCLSRGLSVGETAELCGYSDAFLFSKMFKRRLGVSPAAWKKLHAEPQKDS